MVSGEVCGGGFVWRGVFLHCSHIATVSLVLAAPEEVYLEIASLGPELGAFLESTVMSR